MQYHQKTNSLILRVRDPQRITTHIPRDRARIVQHKGRDYVQVKLGLDEVRVLRNLGYDAPAPIRHLYEWPRNTNRVPNPFDHQIQTSEFLTINHRCICLNDMGTGKTLSALWSADYLMRQGLVKKAVIVTTLSTTDAVWANEIRMHFLFGRKVVVVHGSPEKRKLLLEQDADFYVINHDGVKSTEKHLAGRTDFNLWIVDEAAEGFRNAKTQRYAALVRVLKPTDRLWLMTGTPCPTAPTDAWALGRLLGNPNAPKYFNAFKNDVMLQLTQYKWVPKPDAYERAYNILQPGIRFRKEDCIDLPPVTFQMRDCPMTPEQTQVYKDMHEELVASVNGTPITAANAAVKLTKLLQACVGTIHDGSGGWHNLAADPRLNEVLSLVREAGKKVIVFVPFKMALKRVAEFLRTQGYSVETVSGETGKTERFRIFSAFQNQADPHILVAHPKTTSHGLNFICADTTIWYAPIFSLETFEQANNRMNRPGQMHNMTVAMIASCALEKKLYEALEGKARMQDSVLSLYKKEAGIT